MIIRKAQTQDYHIIVEHFYKLMLEVIVSNKDAIKSNYAEIIQKFINNATENLSYQAFIAEKDDQVIASISCQIFEKPYPQIIKPSCRQWGYIGGLFVEPKYRKQGVGKKLVYQGLNYLKSIGCQRVILHSAPQAIPLYQAIGFQISNELFIDL